MTPPISSSVTARSFGLILVAYFLFASLDAVAKWLATEGYEPLFLAWVRFVLHVLVGGVLLQCWKHPGRYTLSRWPLQGFRGLLLAGATISNFVAVGYLRLDQTMTLFLASPFLVALLAGPLLNEWVGLRRWIAIGVGFIGVLVVMRPGTSMFQWPILYAALATVFLSLYFISTRYLHGESSDSLLLYSAAAAGLVLTPVLFIYGEWPRSPQHWVLFFALGALGAVGHWFFIEAVKLSDASALAPCVYSQLIHMTLLGWILFGDIPDGWTIAGASIIVLSGLYLWSRERLTQQAQ